MRPLAIAAITSLLLTSVRDGRVCCHRSTFRKFLVSMPFVSYGGLLSNDPVAVRLLLEQTDRLRQALHATYVELRHVGYCLDGLQSKEHKGDNGS